jgi:hypothetical protein
LLLDESARKDCQRALADESGFIRNCVRGSGLATNYSKTFEVPATLQAVRSSNRPIIA